MTSKRPFTLGILAHVDAGKTTLAEGMLYLAGEIRTLGRVDHKDAFLDNNQMERERGITIFSKQARFSWGDLSITLLDTPGHVDFSAEMERTLQVLDAAVLVVSGADGVQGHTQTLWKLLERYDIPAFLFVNKMDQDGTDATALLQQIQKKLSMACVDFSSEDVTKEEDISMANEALMEEYLEQGQMPESSLRDAVSDRTLFPVFFGSALKMDGVDRLLDGIARFAPEMDYGEEFAARVFKITRDENGNRLTHLKVTGGVLKAKQLIFEQEKADQLRLYDGPKFSQTDLAEAGEIVAVTGLSQSFAGQGIGGETQSIAPLLEPVLSYALLLPKEVDPTQALLKLKVLEEEDPQLHIIWEEELKEIHVQVMGEVQTEILRRVIRDRFDMNVSFGIGRIVYKESIAKPSYGIGHFEPLRHYAEVHLLLEPGERGSGIQFVSLCSEDVLDKNWQRLIRTHVEETIHRGVLTGSEATDLRIALMTGRAHPKHTEGGDFRQATYRAIRNALRKAENLLLEPVFAFRMELPTEHLGRAMTDVERLCGKLDAPVMEGETAILTGSAPVSTFWEYQKELAAYTGGRGHLTCTLSGYEPCHNTEEVLSQTTYDPEADLRRPTGSVFCAHGAGFPVPWDRVEEYAHMEKVLRLETSNKTPEDADSEMKGFAATSQSEEIQRQKAEKIMSLEEIDAILAQTFHKNVKRENAGWLRKRKTGSRTLTTSSGKSGYKAASAGKDPKANAEKFFLVDGYNIIFAWEELSGLAERNIDSARDRLIDICSDYQGMISATLILVFDAYKVKGNPGSVAKIGNIYVVYTKEAETADAYIEKTTHRLAKDHKVTVATSDRLEQMIIWGNGALRMSAGEFHDSVETGRARLRDQVLDKNSSLENRPFANLTL